MIRVKIDVKKIDKSALFTGSKGTYCDLTLMDNKEGTDQYGNDGFVVMDIGKVRREAGEKGPIIGNWQHVESRGRDRTPQDGYRKPNPSSNLPPQQDEEDDIPF